MQKQTKKKERKAPNLNVWVRYMWIVHKIKIGGLSNPNFGK